MSIVTKFLASLTLVALMALPIHAQDKPDSAADDHSHHQVQLLSPDEAGIGTVTLKDAPGGILVVVEIEEGALSEGWHGFHIHETGRCMPPDYKSAGGHASAEGQEHGVLMSDNHHAGDLPNLWIGAQGSGKAAYFAATDLKPLLDDEDGSAIVIHQTADDYKTAPAGDAGSRVACGVIYPPK